LRAGDLVAEHVHVVGKHHRVDLPATHDRAPDVTSYRTQNPVQPPNVEDKERGRKTRALMHPNNNDEDSRAWYTVKEQLECVPHVQPLNDSCEA
jgi:hypothetical protein